MKIKLCTALLLTITIAITHAGELTNPIKAVCLNSWYNKLTQPKTDVDGFFQKEYTPYLGGLISWERDELKDLELTKVGTIIVCRPTISPEEAAEFNKTSTLKKVVNSALATVKSDLGYGHRSFNQSGPIMNMVQQIAAAARLSAYSTAANTAKHRLYNTILKRAGIDRPLMPQFQPEIMQSPYFLNNTIVIVPVLEELIFTHSIAPLLSYVGGERLGRIVTPLLFGAMHYSQDPLTWVSIALNAWSISYLNISYIQNNPDNTWVPTSHHVIRNAIACLFLLKNIKNQRLSK